MDLDLEGILKRGLRRSVSRNGQVLMGVLFVGYLLEELAGVGVARSAAGQQPPPVDPGSVAPSPLAAVASLLVGVLGLIVTIGAIRVFVGDETERLPREYFTRNVLWAAVNFVVGAIVFGIVVALGFVALVVPGIYLLIALGFWSAFVAVEDQNFVEALRSSWRLTRGHRFEVFVVAVAGFFVTVLISGLFGIGTLFGGFAEVVFTQAGAAVTAIVSTAIFAQTYVALRALPGEGESDADAVRTGSDGSPSQGV